MKFSCRQAFQASLCSWLVALSLPTAAERANAAGPDLPRFPCATGHVLVKFRRTQAREVLGPVPTNHLGQLCHALGLVGAAALHEPPMDECLRQRTRQNHALPELHSPDLDHFLYLQLPPGLTVDECLRKLDHHPLLEYAEPDHAGSGGATIPNDPDFSLQWHHQNRVKPTASIHTPEAWDLTTGSSNVLVAVLDTGLAPDLPEFTGRVVPGFNFVAGTEDTGDDFGHGTAVAGVLCATGNNGVLVAGVDWHCRLMPIKVLDRNNFGYYSWWAQGIELAVASGAKIINLSAGGFSSDFTLAGAVNDAIAHGTIFVTISHNDGSDAVRFPGSLPASITLGATDEQDRRTGFSNYGSSVDLVAPGINMATVSTVGGLAVWWGTSFAAPQAAGVCALLAGLNPSLTQDQARTLLCAGADDQVGDDADAPGFDPFYGWGRLNAYNSLLLAQTRVDHINHRSDGSLEISWSSPPNAVSRQPYRIEHGPTPAGPWNLLPGTTHFSYTASRTSWLDDGSETGAPPGSRFYRVRIWQP